MQISLREWIQGFSQTILTPLADHFKSSLIDDCIFDPLGSCGHEDERSCVVNQERVISLRVPTEHAHTIGECSNESELYQCSGAIRQKTIDKHDESGPITYAHPAIAPSLWEKIQKRISALSFHRQVTYSHIGHLVLSQSSIPKHVRQQTN